MWWHVADIRSVLLSWDRQVWLMDNGVDDGFNSSVHAPGVSVIRRRDVVTRNFVINGYSSKFTIDHVCSCSIQCYQRHFVVFA